MPFPIALAIIFASLALLAFAIPKLVRSGVESQGWDDAKRFVDHGAARAYLHIWFKPGYKSAVLRERYEKGFAESLKVNTKAKEDAEKRQRQADLESSRATNDFLSKHNI